MVDSVSQINSTQTNTSNASADLKKPQKYSVQYSVPNNMERDTVVLQNKPKKNKISNSQIAGIAFGAVSAGFMAIIAGSILRASSVARANAKKAVESINKSSLPQEIKLKLLEELNKAKHSFGGSSGSINYINEVLKLQNCFKKPEVKAVDINKAKEILDSKIVGLDNVKEQVIDFLKVRNFQIKNGTYSSNKLILALDGPPGTGKTSIAEAIAEAIGAPFESVPLSGISEANQIIGDRRLWMGAGPGKIVKAMQHANCSNPVILLDEFDKLGHSFQHGDPADAFIDLFESKRCKYFVDNYLEFPFDLSNANIIVTSNNLQKIPEAIKDRIHVIKIPPYTEELKKDICNMELGKLMKSEKLTSEKAKFGDDAITEIVRLGLDDDGKVSAGARKAVTNMRKVFDKVLIALGDNPNEVVNVDKNFVQKYLVA